MEGNQQIDILMIPVIKAIKKHVKDRDAQIEIYNRAYEAVQTSMDEKNQTKSAKEQEEEF